MNSVLLKRVDEDIENLIELIRKVARAEQKHCILLIEDLQKELMQKNSINKNIMRLLENGFKTLPSKQILIYETYMNLSENIKQLEIQ